MRRTPGPASRDNDTPFDPITVSPALGDGQTMCIRGGRSDTAASRLAVLISVARRLDVPAVCVVLTWTAPTAASYVICTHEAGVEWFVTYDSSIYTCDECGDPCEDADISPDPGSRERNCIRCTPCSICTRCSVPVATQATHGPVMVCLSCATDAEAELLSEEKQRRRLLVAELETLRTDARPGL
jgi:hypothetical protein